MNKEELMPFCGAGTLSLAIHSRSNNPWSRGDHTFATNGHIIVRVPRLEGIEENDAAPDVSKALEHGEAKEWFPLSEIKIPKYSGFVCPECDGSGKEDDECEKCGHQKNCEGCGGTGKIDRITPVAVGEVSFQAKYLALIKNLPNCRIAPSGPETQAQFIFDGGDGSLMPMKVWG
jgi:hypothetical protein